MKGMDTKITEEIQIGLGIKGSKKTERKYSEITMDKNIAEREVKGSTRRE